MLNNTIDGPHVNEIYKSYACQCTCIVSTENAVDSVAYYVIKVALESSS